jgi:aarF domain-containing kinase
VYQAEFKGETIAVKVRHPHVELHIRLDFIIMKWVAWIIESVLGLRWLNLSESLVQFSHTIAAQTRLDIEGKHLEQFNSNFKSWPDISFPRPLVLRPGVLLESWEKGEITGRFITRYVASLPSPHSKWSIRNISDLRTAHFLVTRGEDLYLKMLLQDGLMHADLHPGNILVQPFNSTDSAFSGNSFLDRFSGARLTLVDAGMVAALTECEQRTFVGFLAALGAGRADEAASCVLHFSSAGAEHRTRDQIERFKSDMKTLFARVCRGYGTGTDLGNVLRGILKLMRIHQVPVDTNYATLVVNALCLEGMARTLLPTYSVLDAAKPMLVFYSIVSKLSVVKPSGRFAKLALKLMMWRKNRFDKRLLSSLQNICHMK